MPKTWTVFWGPREIANAKRDGALKVIGSNFFTRRRIAVGDRVWILGSPARGRLHTVGMMEVARKPSPAEVRARFGKDFFRREAYLEAVGKSGAPVREVDLTSIAARLRFVTKKGVTPPLRLGRGAPALGHQLQAMRELDRPSAELIASTFQAKPNVPLPSAGQLEHASKALAAGDIKREVLVRREQQALRRRLFRNNDTGKCELCGHSFPVNLLIASHIKRRSKCSASELVDMGNIAAMCAFGCDGLFERGYVTVANGRILCHPEFRGTGRLAALRKHLHGRPVGSLGVRAERYFAWHRAHHRH